MPGLLLGVMALTLVVACSRGGSAESVTPPPDADLTIAARDAEFRPSSLAVAADDSLQLFFQNLDAQPHNVAIYTDSTATDELFVGEVITDETILYEIPPMAAGSYFLRCDVHPNMTGSVTVG
jgi:plastocyanin